MFLLVLLALSLSLAVATDGSESTPPPQTGTEAPPAPTVQKQPVPQAPGLGEPCGTRNVPGSARCAPGLDCVKSKKDKKGSGSKAGVCACKNDYEVCGSDGVSYPTACELKAKSAEAEAQGKAGIQVKHKGKCQKAPTIVTPPGEVWNVTGSQVFLSCEAMGVPTPVVTWNKISSDKKKMLLLPGDQENLAIQTRGGPEKHEVTGWVLIFPLTQRDAGSYECHATNSKGEASAVGTIHVVDTISDIPNKKVGQDDEL